MSRYRRSRIAGGTYFFTVALAGRHGSALIDNIDRLRDAYRKVSERQPFGTIAICILPDHLHAIWELPEGDADFSGRWSQIKRGFSWGMEPRLTTESKRATREGHLATAFLGTPDSR